MQFVSCELRQLRQNQWSLPCCCFFGLFCFVMFHFIWWFSSSVPRCSKTMHFIIFSLLSHCPLRDYETSFGQRDLVTPEHPTFQFPRYRPSSQQMHKLVVASVLVCPTISGHFSVWYLHAENEDLSWKFHLSNFFSLNSWESCVCIFGKPASPASQPQRQLWKRQQGTMSLESR